MALFLLIVLICVAVGLVGAVVHGLLWLLAIAAVIFVLNFLVGGYRLRGRRTRHS